MRAKLVTTIQSCWPSQLTGAGAVNRRKVEDAVKAHESVCQMLTFSRLSLHMERRLMNLKILLEREIAELKSDINKEDDDGGDMAAD